MDTIPGPDGWRSDEARREYEDAGRVLTDNGWQSDEAASFLKALYDAAAVEIAARQ
jgi:hypothetical protein